MLDTLDIMTIGYQDMPEILYSLVRLDTLATHARDHGMNSLSFLFICTAKTKINGTFGISWSKTAIFREAWQNVNMQPHP